MKLSDNSKRVICIICLILFFLGGGMTTDNIILRDYLPKELFRSLILDDCLKTIAFMLMLSLFEPLKIEYKSKKYYLMYVIDAIIIIYLTSTYVKILVNI